MSALQAKLTDMEEKLALKQESIDRVTASIERQAETSRKELRNLELSLKTQEDLAKLYKEQLERAEECSAKLEYVITLIRFTIIVSGSSLDPARILWIRREMYWKSFERNARMKRTSFWTNWLRKVSILLYWIHFFYRIRATTSPGRA